MKGFFIGLLVAILSFFVFFFFFPGLANRYLGTSFKDRNPDTQQVVTAVTEVAEKTVSTVSEGIQNLIKNSNGN